MKLSAASPSVTAPNVGLTTTADGMVSAAAPSPIRFRRVRRSETSSRRSSASALETSSPTMSSNSTGNLLEWTRRSFRRDLVAIVTANDNKCQGARLWRLPALGVPIFCKAWRCERQHMADVAGAAWVQTAAARDLGFTIAAARKDAAAGTRFTVGQEPVQ